MEKTMNKGMSRVAFLTLGVVIILGSSSPSWAGSRHQHIRQPQVGRCAPWLDCSGSGFSPHPYYPSYNPYDQKYYDDRDDYDDRDYNEERPSYPYNPYGRTVPIPVPGLRRGTGKIIEGMFELLLQSR